MAPQGPPASSADALEAPPFPSPAETKAPPAEGAKGNPTPSIDLCPRSRSFGSLRKLRQVHFKELDECFSSLAIGDHPGSGELPPRPSSRGSDGPVEAREEEDPQEEECALKKEKRLKLEERGSGGARLAPGWPLAPFLRSQTGPTRLELPHSPVVFTRTSASSSPGAHLHPRTSCSTPSCSLTPSVSPFSSCSVRTSAAASPTDRASSCGESTAGGSGSETSNRSKMLFERRGRRSPGQLSLKRSRSVHHTRTWTGKREEVLGAEPGTPRLNKCDTL